MTHLALDEQFPCYRCKIVSNFIETEKDGVAAELKVQGSRHNPIRVDSIQCKTVGIFSSYDFII